MGKRSLDPSEDNAEAVKSLFGANNPFRRKTQLNAFASDAVGGTQPTGSLGIGLDSSAVKKETIPKDKIFGTYDADARKRKRDRRVISASPNAPTDEVPIPRKLKKLRTEAEVDDSMKNVKKRKRDDAEIYYEKKKYGSTIEDQPAASVVAVGEKRKADDAVENMLDSKESFDDESKMLRTIFIGNLPLKLKRKALNREFASFGEIESVRMRSVPLVDSKAPRKAAIIRGQVNEEINSMNAYIVFKEEQSAHAALSFNMTQVGGNHIRVDMACRPHKKMKGEAMLYDKKRTAFIGNLPFDVKDEELYQLFCGLSQSEPNVEAVRVIRDPSTNIGKGIAYVLFKTRDAANRVCKLRNLKIRDRNLRVSHVRSDAFSSKLKENSVKNFPPGKSEKRKREVASDPSSYEGIRSTKTGVVKKFARRKSSPHDNILKRSLQDNLQQVGKNKRPAVAARKATQLKRRKLSSGTPLNTHRDKRARRQ